MKVKISPLVERAIEVATAGKHTYKIITNSPGIYVEISPAFEPCPCGNFMSKKKECSCQAEEIVEYQKTLPYTDITVKAPELRFEDITFEEKIDKEAKELLKTALQQLNFNYKELSSIIRVGKTIAELDSSKELKAQHIAEAIQYQTEGRDLGK